MKLRKQLNKRFNSEENFISCGDKDPHKQCKDWPKIKGVFTEITPICDALRQETRQCEQNSISISFVATGGGDMSTKNLDQFDPNFMYSQILKEILLTIKFGDEHIEEFTNHCRRQFANSDTQLKKVEEFQTKYHTETPISWYTCESFLYPMLNRALRIMNMDIIIKMGFFINDLHRHIVQLHSQQFNGSNSSQTFTVYRGQGMSKTDFDQMTHIQGGLMSFNHFLSTSKDRQVSLFFAESSRNNPDLSGILFVMTIDPNKSTTPFASISDVACYGDTEDEVLFSMHTVFRLGEIIPMDEEQRLFQVNLTFTSDNDEDLRILTDHIREESESDAEGWHRLGLFLREVGEYAKAQQVYETLLEQTTDMYEKGSIFHMLGWLKDDQGEYQEAITFCKKAFEIAENTLSPTDLSLAACYSNIGGVYFNMGDYPKALSSHEKALEIQQQSLPWNHPRLSDSYNNIGNVYYNMGDYQKALSYYQKDLESLKHSLPSNHPDLGSPYDNIGGVYYGMGDYPKALLYYEKALKIRQHSLPSNHHHLGMSYDNIGMVRDNMGDYSKALSSHEKALKLRQESLPSNHPHLGVSYNNIGLVYKNMGDYPKALSSHEKALEIQQQSLPSNHPHLGASYSNIGSVYENIGDYPKALFYYKKALEIRQHSLPSNHPALGASYNNIGLAYKNMGDYPKALSSHEKALSIQQQSLPSNHPHLRASYSNIGSVYENMGDYLKALSYYEKVLELRQRALPSNHSALGDSYNSIGNVYYNMGDNTKAHLFYERAVIIGQDSLPENHPDLQG